MSACGFNALDQFETASPQEQADLFLLWNDIINNCSTLVQNENEYHLLIHPLIKDHEELFRALNRDANWSYLDGNVAMTFGSLKSKHYSPSSSSLDAEAIARLLTILSQLRTLRLGTGECNDRTGETAKNLAHTKMQTMFFFLVLLLSCVVWQLQVPPSSNIMNDIANERSRAIFTQENAYLWQKYNSTQTEETKLATECDLRWQNALNETDTWKLKWQETEKSLEEEKRVTTRLSELETTCSISLQNASARHVAEIDTARQETALWKSRHADEMKAANEVIETWKTRHADEMKAANEVIETWKARHVDEMKAANEVIELWKSRNTASQEAISSKHQQFLKSAKEAAGGPEIDIEFLILQGLNWLRLLGTILWSGLPFAVGCGISALVLFMIFALLGDDKARKEGAQNANKNDPSPKKN